MSDGAKVRVPRITSSASPPFPRLILQMPRRIALRCSVPVNPLQWLNRAPHPKRYIIFKLFIRYSHSLPSVVLQLYSENPHIMAVLDTMTAIPAEIASTLRMKPIQALVWITGWACWTLGSLQYYALPFVLSNVATYLDTPQTDISSANTVTMISRFLGAIVFGILSDQYGRKVPLTVDLILMCGFTIATGFANTFPQLIACRLLFGRSTILVSQHMFIIEFIASINRNCIWRHLWTCHVHRLGGSPRTGEGCCCRIHTARIFRGLLVRIWLTSCNGCVWSYP